MKYSVKLKVIYEVLIEWNYELMDEWRNEWLIERMVNWLSKFKSKSQTEQSKNTLTWLYFTFYPPK